MKKILIAIALLLSPNILFAYVIQNFRADLNVQPNGEIKVTETITVDFSATPTKHGIFRNIPYESETQNGQKNNTPIKNFSVTDANGSRRNFVQSRAKGNEVLKIGSANKYVQPQEIYKINYTIDGVVKNFDGENFDQVYWNVTGNQWDTKILKSSAKITLPNNSSIQKTKCFTGSYGSVSADCAKNSKENFAVFANPNTIFPNEGFTVLYGFDNGISTANKNFEKQKNQYLSWKEKIAQSLGISAKSLNWIASILPFLAGIFGIFLARKETQALKPKKPIVPKYEVPANLHPMMVGTVIDGVFDAKDLTAGVLELAVQKLLIIKTESTESFFGATSTISLQKTKQTNANALDTTLRDGIFGTTQTVYPSLSKTKMRSTFLNLSSVVKQNDFFSENTKKTAKNSPQSNPLNWPKGFGWWTLIPVIISAVFFWPVTIAAVVFSIIGIGIAGPNRTKKGYEMAHELECFKEFLKTAELERLNWASKQEIFEKNLPYAAAFGLEHKWTKIFGNSIIAPTWLVGGSIHHLHKNLDQITQDFSNSIQPPKSSGNSGFSSGGGFSGGGSGGGGGSSW